MDRRRFEPNTNLERDLKIQLLGGGVIMLIFSFAIFFIYSAIFMVLWNNCVRKSFQEDSIKEIDYITAMGMTFFFWSFLAVPVIVATNRNH